MGPMSPRRGSWRRNAWASWRSGPAGPMPPGPTIKPRATRPRSSPRPLMARRPSSPTASARSASLAAGDYPAADQTYRQALDLAEALSRDDPRSLQKRGDADVLVGKIAETALRREWFSEAAEWMGRARANVRASAEAGLIAPGIRAELEAACAAEQAVLVRVRRALDEPAVIAAQPPKLARRLWGVRSLILARRGEVRAGAESAETRRRLAPHDAEGLVIVARASAACLAAGRGLAAAVPGRGRSSPETNGCAE